MFEYCMAILSDGRFHCRVCHIDQDRRERLDPTWRGQREKVLPRPHPRRES